MHGQSLHACAGKMKGQGYFTYWTPNGQQLHSLTKAVKAGFVDADIEKVLTGQEAEDVKKNRKKVMYKDRAVPHLNCNST